MDPITEHVTDDPNAPDLYHVFNNSGQYIGWRLTVNEAFQLAALNADHDFPATVYKNDPHGSGAFTAVYDDLFITHRSEFGMNEGSEWWVSS